MKIIKKTYLVEFPETIENGSSKILCDKPYYIERTETDREVIWWGFETMDESINRLFSLNEELTTYPLIELVDISDNYNIRKKYKRIGNCSDVRNLDFFMETNRVFKGNTMELF
jgi:hypothetical protein